MPEDDDLEGMFTRHPGCYAAGAGTNLTTVILRPDRPRGAAPQGFAYDELGLDDPKWTVDDLIDLMSKHPILINRTFVVTEKGARLARPKEKVLEIL